MEVRPPRGRLRSWVWRVGFFGGMVWVELTGGLGRLGLVDLVGEEDGENGGWWDALGSKRIC